VFEPSENDESFNVSGSEKGEKSEMG
jgi:hypothetical protein